MSLSGERWRFERRQGLISDELIAAATGIRDAHPGDTVVIVVGSSSHAMHRRISDGSGPRLPGQRGLALLVGDMGRG